MNDEQYKKLIVALEDLQAKVNSIAEDMMTKQDGKNLEEVLKEHNKRLDSFMREKLPRKNLSKR